MNQNKLEQDTLEFNKPEPNEFIPRFLKLGVNMETDEHIRWRLEKEHYDKFNSVPKDIRQLVLDKFLKGGVSIKEIAKELKMDSEVIGAIIHLNIQSFLMLMRETL